MLSKNFDIKLRGLASRIERSLKVFKKMLLDLQKAKKEIETERSNIIDTISKLQKYDSQLATKNEDLINTINNIKPLVGMDMTFDDKTKTID